MIITAQLCPLCDTKNVWPDGGIEFIQIENSDIGLNWDVCRSCDWNNREEWIKEWKRILHGEDPQMTWKVVIES